MKAIGPFSLALNTALDIRVSEQPGLCVGVELQNISGMLLRVSIGGKQYWLPAFRLDCFPMDDESNITVFPTLQEVPVGNMLLVRAAYLNDAPDFERAFSGTHPTDIVRSVATGGQKLFSKFSIGQNSGAGAHPLVILGTLVAGDTITIHSLYADVYNFGPAGNPFAGTFQMDQVFQRAIACGPNIGDHDHISLENYNQQFPANKDIGIGVGNYQFQMTPGLPVGIGGTIYVVYSTAFDNPLGGIAPPGW